MLAFLSIMRRTLSALDSAGGRNAVSRAQLQAAVDRLEMAHRRVKDFTDDLAPDEWFWHPAEFMTHVAWQVGHLAVSTYNLCLRRLRGRTQEDESLIPEAFIEHFKLGSKPVAGAEKYPPIAEIQRVYDAVHAQLLQELAALADEDVDVPVEQPHPVFKTKLGAVDYAPSHEMVHIGQIALLRRLMGKPALR
jgi:uncharacterized damage-inducible protein DinB